MNKNKIRQKLQLGEKLKVLFVNDLGFQYGAGIGMLRQIQSFLLMGHEVSGLCWVQGTEGQIPFIPHDAPGTWRGMKELHELAPDRGLSENDIISCIVEEVHTIAPDIVVMGNLHGAKWPLKTLLHLRTLDCLVVAYMHDCYLVSGKCAYPGDCKRYETGCGSDCPKINDYPFVPKYQIPYEWELRRDIFCGPNGIPLAANSRWTLGMARRSLKDFHYADVVHLGLDERLFKPIDRSLARRLLGIDDKRFCILIGAVNVSDRRKGGHFFRDIISSLSTEADFLVFGQESLNLRGVTATGLIRDYRKMPLLYSAADLFLGTSLEEAFGQTFCEAAACCMPVVGFKVGGVPEVAIHDYNARLVDKFDIAPLIEEIRFFMNNPEKRSSFGRNGRKLVEAEYTLRRQGERWEKYLRQITSL